MYEFMEYRESDLGALTTVEEQCSRREGEVTRRETENAIEYCCFRNRISTGAQMPTSNGPFFVLPQLRPKRESEHATRSS